jgi:hypothetical protein
MLAALVGALVPAVTAVTPAAAAESHTYYVDSTDGGAQAKVKLTWYSSSHFSLDWTNCDIRSDARGPILIVNQQIETDALRNVVYDHNLGGKNLCDGKYTDVNKPEYVTKYVVIKECNGGSRDNPLRCDEDYLKNPLIG